MNGRKFGWQKKPEQDSMHGSGLYGLVDALCPFYMRDNGHSRITCEGLVEGSNVCLAYRAEKEYQKQMEIFCCSCYRNCEVFRMLMKKYEDDEQPEG